MRNKIFLSKQKTSFTQKRKRFSSLFTMSFMLVLIALTAWQCREDDFTGEVVGLCPEVVTTSPTNGALNVVSNKQITATFNEAMDPNTINETTFLVKKGTSIIAGTVTYSGLTATFTPAALLEANTVYNATIKRESKNLTGSIMVKDTTWLFNTGASPYIILTDPMNGASDVALNKAITAEFSTAMNATTINANSFTVKQGTVVVPGAVTYAGNTATFTPTNAFVANKVYSATISKLAKDVAGNAMMKDSTWSFSTGTLPLITITNPRDGEVNVALETTVTATFSKMMNLTTINPLTFTLKRGTTVIAGLVTYNDMTATFTPTLGLQPGVEYTATVTTGVKDLSNKTIPADSSWTFTTGTIVIPILPIVVTTDPANLAPNVPINKVVKATFSKVMDISTINSSTFKLMNGTTPVLGYVTYVGNDGFFAPASPLLNGTTYNATITTGAKDTQGNALLSEKNWSFTTEALVVLPIVVSTDPANLAPNVPLNKIVKATFSKVMDDATINTNTFKLMNGNTPVAGAVTYVGNDAFFAPTLPLQSGTTYDATITTGAKDLQGNALANEENWSFTTLVPTIQYTIQLSAVPSEGGSFDGDGPYTSGTSVTVSATPNAGFAFEKWTENGSTVSNTANYTFNITQNRILVANFAAIIAGPPGVDLGSAGNFAVLGGTGVSNIGVQTIITGDVGSFPTATINGLLGGNVIGTLYTVADPIVGLAKTDLTAAYNDAQGRSTDAISLPGQLGGLTLAPGLYVNSSTSGISGTGANGILTLDAGGNPNAVWIFKMGSTLVTDAGTSIVLAGGAQAKNIYWSVGSSATLGTNSIFFGNILADQSITLTTGAKLTGRALTRIGAVTLDTNIVTKP